MLEAYGWEQGGRERFWAMLDADMQSWLCAA